MFFHFPYASTLGYHFDQSVVPERPGSNDKLSLGRSRRTAINKPTTITFYLISARPRIPTGESFAEVWVMQITDRICARSGARRFEQSNYPLFERDYRRNVPYLRVEETVDRNTKKID